MGFNKIAPSMFPCSNSHKARVEPQEGHGIPYIRLNGQTIKPPPFPVELYENKTHTYPVIQATAENMYRFFFYF